MAAEPTRDDWVERLVAFQERLEGKRTPEIGDATNSGEAIDRELEEHKRCLDILYALREAGQSDPEGPPTSSRCDAGPTSEVDPAETPTAPRFQLLEQLGIGGFGIVWQALDPATGRIVALKIPRPEVLARADLRQRFRQEAEVAARLDHPNILPIFEAGVDGMVPYIASPYYDAPTLAEWLADTPGPVAPRLAARIALALADALAHAHDRGVLHRDVKPSNVLLISGNSPSDSEGLPFVPKLMDFGLAKLCDESSDLTRTGELLGTVRYMSPEQAGGRTREIGPKSDTYSLGAILYELLTGAPPFAASSDLEVLRRMNSEEPSRIRSQNAAVPKDLETICLKCLEREPGRRYVSARALRDDLSRFLDDRPILARSSTTPERLVKWARRKPAIAALSAVSALALFGLVVGLAWSNVRISAALEQARASEQVARQRAHETREYAYASDMQLAARAWEANDIAAVRLILDRYERDAVQDDVRAAEYRYLRAALDEPSVVLGRFNGDVGSVAVSPNGAWIAASATDGRLRVWDADTRELVRDWIEPDRFELNGMRFSPDSRLLAVASDSKVVRLFEMPGSPQPGGIGGHLDWVADVDFSPDGKRLATVGADGQLIVTTLDGRDTNLVTKRQQELRSVRFLKDGEHLAVGVELGEVEIFHWPSARLVATLKSPPPLRPGEEAGVWPRKIAVHGNLLAAAYVGGGLAIWDVTDPAAPTQLQHVANGVSRSVSFLGDKSLAVGRSDHAVEIRTLNQAEPDIVHRGHAHQVLCVAASRMRGEVVSGSKDGTVRLWSARGVKSNQPIATTDEDILDVAVAPLQDKLAAVTARGIQILALPSGRHLYKIAIPKAGAPTWSADGHRLATGDGREKVVVFDVSGEAPRITHILRRPSLGMVRFSPVGDLLFISHNSQLEAIDWRTWKSRWKIGVNESVGTLAFYPGKKRLYVGEHRGMILEIDWQSGRLLHEFAHHRDRIHSLCISPDGQFMASSSGGRGDAIWNLETGRIERLLDSTPEAKAYLQFSADGLNLFGTGDRRRISCWHVPTGQQTVALATFENRLGLLTWCLNDPGTMYMYTQGDEQDHLFRIRLP